MALAEIKGRLQYVDSTLHDLQGLDSWQLLKLFGPSPQEPRKLVSKICELCQQTVNLPEDEKSCPCCISDFKEMPPWALEMKQAREYLQGLLGTTIPDNEISEFIKMQKRIKASDDIVFKRWLVRMNRDWSYRGKK